MKQNKQTNHKSNRDSKKERKLNSAQVSAASTSSVHVHKGHFGIYVEEFIGVTDPFADATRYQTFRDVTDVSIIVIKDGRCVVQQSITMNPTSDYSTSSIRFYDVYKLKSASQERYMDMNVLTITLEEI